MKQAHEWQQEPEGMEFLTEAFSKVGELVRDPFLRTDSGEASLELRRRLVRFDPDRDADAVMFAPARLGGGLQDGLGNG